MCQYCQDAASATPDAKRSHTQQKLDVAKLTESVLTQRLYGIWDSKQL